MRDNERRFVMSLALRLGYANPDRMLSEMRSDHLVEWEAYAGYLEWEAQSKKGR